MTLYMLTLMELLIVAVYIAVNFFRKMPQPIPEYWYKILAISAILVVVSWVYFHYKLGLWKHEYQKVNKPTDSNPEATSSQDKHNP